MQPLTYGSRLHKFMGLDQGDEQFGSITKSEWGSQGLILWSRQRAGSLGEQVLWVFSNLPASAGLGEWSGLLSWKGASLPIGSFEVDHWPYLSNLIGVQEEDRVYKTLLEGGDHLLQSMPAGRRPPLVSELTTLKERRALMAFFTTQVSLQRVFENLGPSVILNCPSSTPPGVCEVD